LNETPLRLEHLTKRPQFLAAAKGLSSARGAVLCQMLARCDDQPTIRIGFTATKRLGGAVVRNRAKRRLRQAARQVLSVLGKPGADYVFIARQGAATRPWERLVEDMQRALLSLAPKPDTPRSRQP
jgi:ribonuclease P protein component